MTKTKQKKYIQTDKGLVSLTELIINSFRYCSVGRYALAGLACESTIMILANF